MMPLDPHESYIIKNIYIYISISLRVLASQKFPGKNFEQKPTQNVFKEIPKARVIRHPSLPDFLRIFVE